MSYDPQLELGEDHPPIDMWLSWLPAPYEFGDRRGSLGQRGVLRVRRDLVLPVIRSLDGDDVIIRPGLYEIAMEVMATKRRRALYFVGRYTGARNEDGELVADERVGNGGVFFHHVGVSGEGRYATALPGHLDGCVSPGIRWHRDGVIYSDRAMGEIFDALGGWRAHARFRLLVL